MKNFSISGDFGQIKLGPAYLKSGVFTSLDHINGCSWHSVNDLYRIDRPQGTRDYLLMFTVSGKGHISQNGKTFMAVKDTLSIIPPNTPCCYYAPEKGNWEFYWFHITGNTASAMITDIMNISGELVKIKVDTVEKYLNLIINSKYLGVESEISAAGMVSKILFSVIYAINEGNASYEGDDVVFKIIDYIEDNDTAPFCLDQISKKYFISKEHLIRIFKQRTGTTPYRYYRHFRIVKSTHALAYTDTPIYKIACSAGYSSETSYSIQFKKEMNMSPSEYRKAYKYYQN